MDTKKVKNIALGAAVILTLTTATVQIRGMFKDWYSKNEGNATKQVSKSEIFRYINTKDPNELVFQIGNYYFKAVYEKNAESGNNLSQMASIQTINRMGGYDALIEAFAPICNNPIDMPKVGDPLYKVEVIENPTEVQAITAGISSGKYVPLKTNPQNRSLPTNTSELSDRL